MSNPVDEILASLEQVGLRLVTLGERPGADRWLAMVGPEKPVYETYHGQGPTPAAALIQALRRAGVDVEDDGP